MLPLVTASSSPSLYCTCTLAVSAIFADESPTNKLTSPGSFGAMVTRRNPASCWRGRSTLELGYFTSTETLRVPIFGEMRGAGPQVREFESRITQAESERIERIAFEVHVSAALANVLVRHRRPQAYQTARRGSSGAGPGCRCYTFSPSVESILMKPGDRMPPRKSAIAVLTMAIVMNAFGQGDSPSFEVASIKRNTGGQSPDFAPRRSGDRVAMHDVRLPSVVIYAYHLEHGLATTSYQLAGNLQMPEGWEVYDIDAVAPGSPTDEDLRAMFRRLLAERFRLKAHWETKELTGYDLTVAKNGPKLKPGEAGGRAAEERRIERAPGVSHLIGRRNSIEQLVSELSARLESPVRNLTGLTGGAYDYDVPFASEVSVSDTVAVPDLASAIEKELGLKLTRSRVPVEVLVVDHVERPAGN
jgi:uncharacterized protein (TIGR03435 family)